VKAPDRKLYYITVITIMALLLILLIIIIIIISTLHPVQISHHIVQNVHTLLSSPHYITPTTNIPNSHLVQIETRL